MDPAVDKLISEVHGLCLALFSPNLKVRQPMQAICARISPLLVALYERRKEADVFWQGVSTRLYPATVPRLGTFGSHVSPFEFERRITQLCKNIKRVGDGAHEPEVRMWLAHILDTCDRLLKDSRDKEAKEERQGARIYRFPAARHFRLITNDNLA